MRGRIRRANSPYQITTLGFHTLVRRQQPACAIAAMKACPGLRSGIDSRPSIRHSYESMSRTPIRDVPFNQPRCRLSTGETCRFVDRWSMAERENVARGLVPRWGRGGAWQNPPCQLAIPNHNSGFSHLGAPATAGMCDCCYESMSRTTIRDRLPPLNSSFQRKLESRRGGEGEM